MLFYRSVLNHDALEVAARSQQALVDEVVSAVKRSRGVVACGVRSALAEAAAFCDTLQDVADDGNDAFGNACNASYAVVQGQDLLVLSKQQ